MSLISSSQTTLKILADGFYHSPSGEVIHFQAAQNFTVEHTQLYTPPLINTLRDQLHLKEHTQPTISVLDGTTQVIAQRYAPSWDLTRPPQDSSSHFVLFFFFEVNRPLFYLDHALIIQREGDHVCAPNLLRARLCSSK